jgi:ATP phosphoribosyltransferase
VPRDSGLETDRLGGLHIATAYPNRLPRDLDRRGHTARLVRLDGAVEIAIRLGVVDIRTCRR